MYINCLKLKPWDCPCGFVTWLRQAAEMALGRVRMEEFDALWEWTCQGPKVVQSDERIRISQDF